EQWINTNTVEISKNIMEDSPFDKMNTKEIISSMSSSSNQISNKTILFENNFSVIADKIIKDILNMHHNVKQKILNLLDKQNITPQEIYNWLLNNQNNSNYIDLLGNFYLSGIGTSINKQKAFELFQKAANLGSVSGIIKLGNCYQNGIGTGIDRQKAFELYQRAADLGSITGINNLGNCYQNGIRTSVDRQKAF